MTVREWFRGMRSTDDGRRLAFDLHGFLTGNAPVLLVYGVQLVPDLAAYEYWERLQQMRPTAKDLGL